MATTTGQHPVSSFTSPVNGDALNADVVRGNDNSVRDAYVDHDADTGIHVQSSALASRPAASIAGRKWITADTGSFKLWYDDGATWNEVSNSGVDVYVIADETLAKGDVIKVTGFNNGAGAVRVAKVASASDVAFGVVSTIGGIANGATGYVTNTGLLQDVNTASFAIGDILYPNTSGWFTTTKPSSGTYQPCAYVLRSNLNNGVLYVEFSAPRIVETADVGGPASSTDTAVALFSGTTGKVLINSGVLVDGSNNVTGVAALTASGAVTTGSIVNNGTLNLSAAGAGQIQFPATQNPSANANTLDDYEEGTFTPTGNNISLASASGSYTKIGRMVAFRLDATWPSTASGSIARMAGLPFPPATGTAFTVWSDKGTQVQAFSSASFVYLYDASGVEYTNANMSTKSVSVSGVYFV